MNLFSKSAVAAAAGIASLMLTTSALAQAAAPTVGPPPGQKADAGAPPPGDPLGPDLFLAIRSGTPDDVKAALARGAKTESRNWLGITPLMWAAALGNEQACAALIAAKADVNAPSHYGTALSFAEMGASTPVVRLLLDHGAKLTEDRTDGITPLMTAAENGRLDAMRLLLERVKADVNKKDGNGTSALLYAARRGRSEAARLLLDAGADVNAFDKEGRTALMYAAINGYPDTAALLLERRAQVNARDHAGNSALLLAARYRGEADLLQVLVRAGADTSLRDAKGRTALALAQARENPTAVAALSAAPAAVLPVSGNEPLPVRAREALSRSLPLIERGTRTFSEQAACTSCHHQGLGLMTTGLARERGFGYDRQLALEQIQRILKSDAEHGGAIQAVLPHPEQDKHVPGVDMGELTPALAFLYSGLLAHGEQAGAQAGEIQSQMTVLLARQQSEEGQWGFSLARAPIQSSVFATTALAARVLQHLMPRERAAETAQRLAKARGWLVSTPAVTNEDRVFRLLGLKWTGAEAGEIQKATAQLLAWQRSDGGWSQLGVVGTEAGDAYTRSDAYATGQALYALHIGGGVAPTAAAYVRGVGYLVRTQDDDGSWLVTKRAIPANTYLDAGFPHGHSQYISYGATCWASMALMLATQPETQPETKQQTVNAR